MSWYQQNYGHLGEHPKRSFISRYARPVMLGGLAALGIGLYMVIPHSNNVATQNLSIEPVKSMVNKTSEQSTRYLCIPRSASVVISYVVSAGDTVYGILYGEGLAGQEVLNAAELLAKRNPNKIGPSFEITAGDEINVFDLNCDGTVGTGNPSEVVTVK